MCSLALTKFWYFSDEFAQGQVSHLPKLGGRELESLTSMAIHIPSHLTYSPIILISAPPV